jgi:hypothetical protein
LTSSLRSTPLCLVLAIGLTVLSAGCSGAGSATAPGLPTLFPDHSAQQIRTQIRGAADTVRAYTAKARITVRTPNQNRSFNAVVRHRRADSLYMRLSLFGIEGGRLLLTPDSVFFYDTRQGVLRVGPVQAVQNLFPAPVSSRYFFANMLGLIAPNARDQWSVQADSSLYYVSDPGGRRHYTVDPTRWRTVRYEERNPTGDILQSRRFSNFRPINGLLLPSRVAFKRPSANLQATVAYKSMSLNPSGLSFELDVPPQVPRRPFR